MNELCHSKMIQGIECVALGVVNQPKQVPVRCTHLTQI